ncbi:MAG TPA: helix-turn-helix domain-containing GNAT family N-acetyltransferase [Solirubrobacteraceae bacterium]|nr:helix-turn-helix domain-containing GNAT family N-acetyltransferase [Solirubrobacteraceae bacterium]
MTGALVDQVRSFNRIVTQRVGALDEHYLKRNRPLGQDRVLWEIGTEGCEVRALRSRLGLDAGHLSRLLRALEDDGLVLTQPSPADRRIRRASLTRAGRQERAVLDRRSDELAESILAPLDLDQRDELVKAMRTVRRLLTTSTLQIQTVDPTHEDARRCLRAYFAELDRRSDSGFDPAKGISAEPEEVTPPAGRFLVAYLNGEPVGCGAVKHHAGAPSEIKRMWVAESARGLGIARHILADLETDAKRARATATRLETNTHLVEAIAMYRSAGYVEVPAFNDEPFAHHWFEKQLTVTG